MFKFYKNFYNKFYFLNVKEKIKSLSMTDTIFNKKKLKVKMSYIKINSFLKVNAEGL